MWPIFRLLIFFSPYASPCLSLYYSCNHGNERITYIGLSSVHSTFINEWYPNGPCAHLPRRYLRYHRYQPWHHLDWLINIFGVFWWRASWVLWWWWWWWFGQEQKSHRDERKSRSVIDDEQGHLVYRSGDLLQARCTYYQILPTIFYYVFLFFYFIFLSEKILHTQYFLQTYF